MNKKVLCAPKKQTKRKICKLTLAGFYNATAFIGELAILKASSRWVRSLPFGAAAGAGGFVFVTPDF
jgi:hypothetical protein